MACAALVGDSAVQGNRKGTEERPGLVPWLLSGQTNIAGQPWNNHSVGFIPLHLHTELKYLYKPRNNFYLMFSLGFTGCLEHPG